MEQVLTEIWCEVLNVKSVGIQDNFFDVGGHSILLSMVQELIATRVEKKIELIDLFTYPTIQSLAKHLDEEV